MRKNTSNQTANPEGSRTAKNIVARLTIESIESFGLLVKSNHGRWDVENKTGGVIDAYLTTKDLVHFNAGLITGAQFSQQ